MKNAFRYIIFSSICSFIAIFGVFNISLAFDLGSNLDLHYLLNDNASSTVVLDNVGNYDGTAQANTADLHVEGLIDGAFDFNSYEQDYIDTGYQKDFGTEDFTINYWSYVPTGASAQGISNDNAGYSGFLLDYYGSSLYMSSNGSSWDIASNVSTGDEIKNAWYMLTLKREGSTFTIYKNGTYVSGFSSSASLKDASSPIEIGRTQGGIYHHGYIDDVRIYSRALTTDDITALYNSGAGTEEETIEEEPTATTTITVDNLNGTLSFGLALIIYILSIIFFGFIFNTIKNKKI